MAMAWIWSGMVVLSLIFGLCTGNLNAVSAAALEGAAAAVELGVSMAGVLCLWSGVMEMMNASGLSAGLAKIFRPLLRRLLPSASQDPETLAAGAANVSANLLGLGTLVVLNTASIQLIPATVGSLRAAMGSAAPFDILPAVWLSSVLSVTAGLAAARLLSLPDRRRS